MNQLNLRSPKLGPIVGHTTARSCRLWIQAEGTDDTVGIITVLKENGQTDTDKRRTHYFRLRREEDQTGTFNLGEDSSFSLGKEGGEPFPLEPNTTYQVKMAALSLKDVVDHAGAVSDDILFKKLPTPSSFVHQLAALGHETEATFRTFPEIINLRENLSFLLCSCRYPIDVRFWKGERSDDIFKPMMDQVFGNINPARFVLMVGDQIYADPCCPLPIFAATTDKDFKGRYQKAFGSPNMRRLLRSVPQYMTLDDHEIENNWAQDKVKTQAGSALFDAAMRSYRNYQWSHGPRSFDKSLYYQFEYGGIPFFVLDERTERYKEHAGEQLDDNGLIGLSQLNQLCQWLEKQQKSRGDIPKFIVSASVFVPNPIRKIKDDSSKSVGADSWPAFPSTRRALLQTIIAKSIQNVVFLSGDIHCSCVTEIAFSGHAAVEKIKAFSIVSSPLYCFPFTRSHASRYVQNSKDSQDTFVVDQERGITMDYHAFNFVEKDNFCRIDFDRAKNCLDIVAIGADGLALQKTRLNLSGPI